MGVGSDLRSGDPVSHASKQLEKAVALLRTGHTWTLIPVPVPIRDYCDGWSYRIGLFNTHTGQRIHNIGRTTFSRMRKQKLLSRPAKFASQHVDPRRGPEPPTLVFTLRRGQWRGL